MIWKITTTKDRSRLSRADQRSWQGNTNESSFLRPPLKNAAVDSRSHPLFSRKTPPHPRFRAFSTCQRKGLIGISRRVSKSFSSPLYIFFAPTFLCFSGAPTPPSQPPTHSNKRQSLGKTWHEFGKVLENGLVLDNIIPSKSYTFLRECYPLA